MSLNVLVLVLAVIIGVFGVVVLIIAGNPDERLVRFFVTKYGDDDVWGWRNNPVTMQEYARDHAPELFARKSEIVDTYASFHRSSGDTECASIKMLQEKHPVVYRRCDEVFYMQCLGVAEHPSLKLNPASKKDSPQAASTETFSNGQKKRPKPTPQEVRNKIGNRVDIKADDYRERERRKRRQVEDYRRELEDGGYDEDEVERRLQELSDYLEGDSEE